MLHSTSQTVRVVLVITCARPASTTDPSRATSRTPPRRSPIARTYLGVADWPIRSAAGPRRRCERRRDPAHADLVLVGHSHNESRLTPAAPPTPTITERNRPVSVSADMRPQPSTCPRRGHRG
jgi:hypothetical protein